MSSRLILLFGLLASAAALAQVEEPNGIKVGDGRLHPYFDLEGRYDSAVAGNPGQLKGDIAVRFRPGLRFELLGADNVIQFNGNAEYVLYTGLLDSSGLTKKASRFQTDLGLDAAFNKSGPVEFQIGDQFIISDRTNNQVLTIGAKSTYNNARVAVPIHPGGGALEVSPKASYAVEFFEPLILPDSVPPLSDMNYSNLNVGLGARWRFLPKTAIVLDGGLDYRTYFNVVGTPATLMKVQAGLAGLISTKISLLLLAGYGRDFGRSAASTVIAQAEVGILLSDLITFKAGYLRTIQPVPLYGTFGDDRGYGEARIGVGRFSLVGSGAFDFLSFAPAAPPVPARNDSVVTLSVSPSVKIFSWFAIVASYNLTVRLSSNAASRFTRHEAILQLHFSY